MWCISSLPITFLRTVVLVGLLLAAVEAGAQARSNAWGLGGEVTEWPLYPRFEMEYLEPEVHRWYAPRHLLETHLRPWYVIDSLQDPGLITSYVSEGFEGRQWYDTFGRPLGRGWLVYNWQHEQARRDGSLLRKRPGATGLGPGPSTYSSFFQNLVIASDQRGGSVFRLMVGDRISTRFTPLTFDKPRFNGMRFDYASGHYSGSAILARPSSPDALSRSQLTHLMGGHFSIQTGPVGELGFTYVNAHNVTTQRDFSFGNPMQGTLTSDENQPLQKLWVEIRDDSPLDGEGGPVVFAHEIVLIDTAGNELRGQEIDFRPRVEGGRLEDGMLVADGGETILLEYDLAAFAYEEENAGALTRATVELAVANDYRIEVASNLQTDGQRTNQQIVFLTAERAEGNVQDESNSRLLRLDYGLPTANELIGVNWDLASWKGLSVQGEAVLNRQYSKYPNLKESRQHLIVDEAHAAYVNAAYNSSGWGLYGEAFSIADEYSTSYWLVDSGGKIKYKAPIPELYEFVEDDDDHDGIPEWRRPYHSSGDVVWPGYDENGDFLYDYNQNDNLIPDYEEPFLRFRSDRPEFLFGVDMNHNGMIDRFENDLEPDYPYRRDHRGTNAYARVQVGPNARLIVGRQRMGLISGDGRTHTLYGLATWRWDRPRWGRLRFSGWIAEVRDDIPNDQRLWMQPVGGVGRMRDVRDLLPAKDAREYRLYADLEQRPGGGLWLLHRIKWEEFRQNDMEEVRLRGGRDRSGFFGLIDKAEWTIPIGLGFLEPRFKSEYRRDRPFLARLPVAVSLEETVSLLWVQPLLQESSSVTYFTRYGRQLFDTELQVGVELTRFWMLEGMRDEIDQDFRGRALVAQVVNRVGYQGYRLVTRIGLQWSRRSFEQTEDTRSSELFVTINAGLN
jgi:hypothetical protein